MWNRLARHENYYYDSYQIDARLGVMTSLLMIVFIAAHAGFALLTENTENTENISTINNDVCMRAIAFYCFCKFSNLLLASFEVNKYYPIKYPNDVDWCMIICQLKLFVFGILFILAEFQQSSALSIMIVIIASNLIW